MVDWFIDEGAIDCGNPVTSVEPLHDKTLAPRDLRAERNGDEIVNSVWGIILNPENNCITHSEATTSHTWRSELGSIDRDARRRQGCFFSASYTERARLMARFHVVRREDLYRLPTSDAWEPDASQCPGGAYALSAGAAKAQCEDGIG